METSAENSNKEELETRQNKLNTPSILLAMVILFFDPTSYFS